MEDTTDSKVYKYNTCGLVTYPTTSTWFSREFGVNMVRYLDCMLNRLVKSVTCIGIKTREKIIINATRTFPTDETGLISP